MNRAQAGSGVWFRLVTSAAAGVIALTACGSSNGPSGSTAAPPPTANMAPPTSIGAGEGALNLIAWEGYTDTSWVKPFTAATGCKVNATVRGVLRRDGHPHGGGRWRPVGHGFRFW